MASIQAGIQLVDRFTAPLMSIINSVNMAVSQMETLNNTMNTNIDTQAYEGIRNELSQATIAADELNEAMQNIQQANSRPEPVQQPFEWQSDGLQVFDTSGVQRYEQEIQSAEQMLNQLNTTQAQIAQQAAGTDVFSANAVQDINAMSQRIQAIQQRIQELESNPLDIDADRANNELEHLRAQLNQAVGQQDELNKAVQDMDVSNANAAYLRLSETVSQTERRIRDSFSQPIEIPVEWSTNSLDVFTGTGIERYEQEIQSAEQMLNQLSTTQTQIAQQAAGTGIFSTSAVRDISTMGQRIQVIQQRIQELESNPLDIDADRANNELEHLRAQLNQAVGQQQQLNDAVRNMDVSAANQAYNQLSQTIGGTERHIRDSTTQQQNFNQTVQNGVSGAKSLVAAFMGLSLVRKAINIITGQLDSAIKRMDTMTTYNRTMTAITGSSDIAAVSLAKLKDVTKGTAYGLDAAARAVQTFVTRGMGTGEAVNQVKSWADAVAFYGDGTSESLTEVTDALGKMLTKGKVEMVQLDRLTYRGINAVGMYAQATGQSASDVQTNLSKGNISAQEFVSTVSNAFENGTNGVLNISGAAKKAGDTWAASIANAKAAITRGLINMIDGINEGLSRAGLGTILDGIKSLGSTAETVLNNIANMIPVVLGLLSPIVDWLGNVASVVKSNWSTISPIIHGVAIAFSVYGAILLALKIKQIACAAAQWVFNAAISASPLTWMVLIIGVLIGLLLSFTSRIVKSGGAAKSSFGVICGGINVAIQFFKELRKMALNVFNGIGKAASVVGYNIMTAFHNAICSVQSFWYDLLSTVISVISDICKALNELPFVSFDYTGVASAADHYAAKSAEAANNKRSYKSISEAYKSGSSKYDAFKGNWKSEAYKSGASFGDGVTNKVKNMLSGNKATKDPSKKDYEKILRKSQGNKLNQDTAANTATTAKNTAGTAKNTAKSAQALSATSEDLKYLRDMAAQRYINRFTTAKITVHQTNHNKISKKLDLDGVTEHLRKTMEEQMISAAEGVHI